MSKGRTVSVRVNMEPHLASLLKWLKYKYSVEISGLVCKGLAGRVQERLTFMEGLPANHGVEWLADPSKEQLEKLREDVEFEKEEG